MNFYPARHHARHIKVIWKQVLLNPLAPTDAPEVDMSSKNLSSLLFDIYGPLSFMELVQLMRACESLNQLKSKWDPALLFQLQGRQWSERLSDLCHQLQNTPQTFQEWARLKQMDVKDLQPLLSLKGRVRIDPLLEDIAQLKVSRTEGKQILDLLVDLILMENQTESLRAQDNPNWLKVLKQKRYPMSHAQEKHTPSNKNLPRYAQIVNFRQGDRLLKKLQITYSDSQDLKDKLNRLSSQESLT